MEVLNNLEEVELLTTYQKNDIIVSTCLFLIFFNLQNNSPTIITI